MAKLYDQATGVWIGDITDENLQFLMDNLEEESLLDRDYAITRMTVDFLETQGADPNLVALLRKALAGREEVSVRWSRA